MKRFTVLLFLMLPLFAAAQIAVADFSINLRDQDANNEATKVIDDNGEVCALIKIETTQKGFSFDGGTVGVAKVDDSQVGEIWVWVPAGLRRLTIKHQQLGVLRDYYFPMQLQKGRTYIMKLVTGSVETVVQQKSSTQWLVLNFEPKDAMVEVDGDIVDCSNGIYKKMLPIGEHNVRVSARNYHTDAAKVMLTESETGKLTISLKPAFGWIEITGPSGATVFIDNGKIGEVPVKSQPLPVGAKIYIDGSYAGESPMMRNGILVGRHTIKASYGDFQDEVKDVDIEEGKTSEVSMNLSKPKYYVSANGTLDSISKDFKGDLVIGNEVISIGYWAFEGCDNLIIYVPKGTIERFKAMIPSPLLRQTKSKFRLLEHVTP